MNGRQPRAKKTTVTAEMVTLFERGLELVAEGHDSVDDRSPKHLEFIAIDKKLNWSLLRQPLHAISVLDPVLDKHQMPRYMQGLAAGRDWAASQRLRRALMEELAHAKRSQRIADRPVA